MRYRILDIETLAHEDAGNWLDPVEPDGRLTDPVKIKADIAKKEAERAEKLALDPDCCRIVCLGYHDCGTGDPICDPCQDEFEERAVLEAFWTSYRAQDTSLVAFYGFGFDLPVLMRRSMYLGVPHQPLNVDRYRSPHIDVLAKLTYNGVLKPHSLSFYQRRLGLPTLDKVKGSEIAGLVKAGDWDAVVAHCLSDIGLTHALANRLGLLKL